MTVYFFYVPFTTTLGEEYNNSNPVTASVNSKT